MATRKSQLPAHARTPIHKSIGPLAPIHSPSTKTPIARSSIALGAFHTPAAPRATASTGTARTERNARLWDDRQTALSSCASHPPRSQIPTSGKHTHEYIDTRRQFTRPAPPLNTRSTSRNCAHDPSQPARTGGRKRESACVGWGCANERIWMRTSGGTAELKAN